MDRNFQQLLMRELAEFARPLAALADNPREVFDFLYRIGWDLESFLGNESAELVEVFTAVAGAVDALDALADDPPRSLADLTTALDAARTLFGLIGSIPSRFGSAVPPEAEDLPGDIVNALALAYLQRRCQRLYRALCLLTVVRRPQQRQAGVGDRAIRMVNHLQRIDLDRLRLLLTRPGEAFAAEYWPDGIPDRERAAQVAARLFPKIQDVLVPHDSKQLDAAPRISTFAGRGTGPDELPPDEELRLAAMMTLIWTVLGEEDGGGAGFTETGVSVGILPGSDGGPGVFAVPIGAVEFVERIGDWLAVLTGSAGLPGFKITDSGFEFFSGEAGVADVELLLGPVPDEASNLLIGSVDGTRLEIGGYFLSFGLRRADERAEVRVMVSLMDAAFVIAADGADGFLSNFLPAGGSRVAFEVTAGWSNLSGFHVRGSGALQTRIPAHAQAGPVTVTGVVLGIAVSDDGIAASVGADLKVSIGPITVVVQDVGLRLAVGFPDGGGNAGPLELTPGFKPPSGAGVVLDAGVVTGGGLLTFDPQRGEYAGVLELEFTDLFSLKGIGLISTRNPDGSSGFSMLIILTAEFPEPGLQLGFGFRLLAVGGLIGVNRTVSMRALMDGVRTGAIESIMFPRDVIANAPRILSDLRTFFPPQDDRFLIGPMAKLAWGSPAIVTASLAVIIEIPGNITFAGVLRAALPRPENPILLLQVNFAGAVEPDQQRFYFTASLFESRILHLGIDGEMGVLIGWGDDPNLVLTVGGFHPSYTPPPLPFPTPRRVSIDLLNESNARLRVSGYFAVTSNTAQFGAQAELYFKFSAFRVEGHLGFDALFQFSPFAFAIEVRASVSLKAFGVGCFSIKLRFALEGPTPWRAHGRGSVSLFFFDISANFDVTWGEKRDTTLPPVRVLPILAAELSKPDNWLTRSASGRSLVTLRDFGGTGEGLVLHPMGTLFVRQRAIPLDLKLDRIGAQRPSDTNRLTVEVTSGGLAKRSDVTELFAPAQFQDMDDAAKLSRPAFQRQHAGLELAPDGNALTSVRAVRRTARYEEIVIDAIRPRDHRRFVVFAGGLFTHFLRGNSISRSELSQAQRGLVQPFADAIRVSGEQFAVARTENNTAAMAPFDSEATAREFLAGHLAANPGLAGTLHVIPGAEVVP
ncbi:MAG TPA: DUF6603 domain-containing protein [Candidatus Limnocylindrales bacterium]